MSQVDKQALRSVAENATPGEWCKDECHGVIADAGLNANYYIASCSGPEHRANARYIASANPATMLALLNENEALEKRVAELEARVVNLPKRSVGEVMHMSGFTRDYAEGWCSGNDNAIHAIRAAGIGVNVEDKA